MSVIRARTLGRLIVPYIIGLNGIEFSLFSNWLSVVSHFTPIVHDNNNGSEVHYKKIKIHVILNEKVIDVPRKTSRI